MAKKTDERKKRTREKSGPRLKELLEKKGIKQSDFLQMLKKEYGSANGDDLYLYGLNDLSTLSNILNGRRTLQNEHAKMAAEILDIDVNYLLGTVDDFKEPSYDAYYYRYGNGQMILRKDWEKYGQLLEMGGFKLVNTIYSDNNLVAFSVSDRKQTKTIQFDDMENFYEDVRKYIKKRFDSVMDLGE